MKPINYQTGLAKGYSLVEWAILGVCLLVLAVIVSALGGCTIAPTAPTSTAPSLAWKGYLSYQGQPGERGNAYARELWLSYLKTYGSQIQPANPDKDEGWVKLPDGSWWVANPQVLEWSQMEKLSEIK